MVRAAGRERAFRLHPARATCQAHSGSQGPGGAGAEGLQQAGAEGGGWGTLTDLQVGASFLSRNGMVICSSASRKKRFRTELLS